jgi:hypothetical protein
MARTCCRSPLRTRPYHLLYLPLYLPLYLLYLPLYLLYLPLYLPYLPLRTRPPLQTGSRRRSSV